MINNERLRRCWIGESLRNYSELTLTKASLVTERCKHRVESSIVCRCEHPGARRKRGNVYDMALSNDIEKGFPFCTAVAIYLASIKG